MFIISIIFVVLIFLYIAVYFKQMSNLDIIMISISILVLSFNIGQNMLKRNQISEQFIEHNKASSNQNYILPTEKITIEEEVDDITKSCILYVTPFNSKSYSASTKTPKVWTSIINNNNAAASSPSPKYLKFDTPPIFKPPSGFYLGNNKVTGPNGNELGIDFLSVYSIVLVCKHGNLSPSDLSNSKENIELLKMYAVSEKHSNGLSLFIPTKSIQNKNNVQVGALYLSYADNDPSPCLVKKEHELINFDKDILTFYFIIKEKDVFRIQMMTETNPVINTIFSFHPKNDDVQFSNNPIIINRLSNWNANIYNLSIYNQPLSDDEVTKTYNHIMNEYMKQIDANLKSVVKTYNNTIDTVSHITKCPFNKNTCNQCSSVNKWYSTNNIINSSQQCRTAINDFCKVNTKNSWCKCWDPNFASFNSQQCQLYRAVYGGKKSILDNLTDQEIEELKKKYGFVTSQDCEASLAKRQQQQKEEVWNKIKDVHEPSREQVHVKAPISPKHKKCKKKTVVPIMKKLKEIVPSHHKHEKHSHRSHHNNNSSSDEEEEDIIHKEKDMMKALKHYTENNNNNGATLPTKDLSYFDKFLKIVIP